MFLLSWFFVIISIVVLFFLVFPFLEVLFSFFFPEKLNEPSKRGVHDFGLVITAYKNAEITFPLIESLLKQEYDQFVVYLVADASEPVTLPFQDERLVVLFPDPSLNLKVKSIIYALEHFKREHEYVIVFDADNLAHPKFLSEINRYINAGFQAIQGQRTAKNLDTHYARMDSIGEFYKNYVERFLPYRLNGSAVISGSGMAVETDLYRGYLDSPEIQEGQKRYKKMMQEDKILQNYLLRKNKRIAFAWDAIVYDEKVTTAGAVETQRSRWLYSYFQNIPNALGIIRRGLFQWNWNQCYFGLITISPPLFILVFLAGILFLAGLFIFPLISLLLIFAMVIFTGNFLLTLYLSKVPTSVWGTVWKIPLFVWQQVKALLKMSNPDKNFKPTEHNRVIEIERIVKEED